MSSTQHQLIEQCAIRLRGIVEALDNIHDNTPHRWSTDLDDVHSSAESLLALIKDQAPARSEASFEEWLANELEGEDGQPVPAAVCDIALARRAFNHWPKLEQPAKVGGVRFSAGVSSRLVVEAAQRLYEFESTPEKEAERIERLQAFREQLDPLNLAPHAEAFNEAPADALRPEQAEAERSEVVARVDGTDEDWFIQPEDETELHNEGLLFAGCELGRMIDFDRIVGALRAENAKLIEALDECDGDRWRLRSERDAVLARVAELETALEPFAAVADAYDDSEDDDHEPYTDMGCDDRLRLTLGQHRAGRIALEGRTPQAQAQHSVPDHAELLQALERTHAGHMVGHDQSDQPKGGYSDGYVNGFGECIKVARKVLAAAPSHSTPVPQAWIDVLAERRRQVEAEGWTPEHDDEHSHGQMARAAACYALAGSSAPNDGTAALLVSLAWPWDQQWWKPTSARRDLVKACALALAEIERLDRAAANQGGPRDA
ncbi:hypothetical protein [Pseudomonas aeruginosa]|uniref:hypothetical protein n=1 Tax=Pseudomonas aeruginosa TaxID=287 RepID=UPI0003BAE50A|nr:hypothetical protein [Pseudomonas aeruginosa]ERZ34577.1 hypothetical protein Q003_00424 [Pseudomonas aeruginosa CF27]